MDVTIVIPVYNQMAYTQGCLRGLAPDLAEGVAVVVVNNGSTDGTREWLDQQKGITAIHNPANRGCAAAWNQGCSAVPADWTIVLNNDVLLPAGWRNALLGAADRAGLDIVSPAIREGEQNYDFDEYAREFTHHLGGVMRPGAAHGICFAVRRAVFARIGGFDETFRIGQFEDADFFRRAARAGFALGITGACFLHHFGSATQKALRSGSSAGPYEAENRAYFRKKWRLSWLRRRWERLLMAVCLWAWRTREHKVSGHTLHEKWQDGRLQFF
ncbi:MAG: glycosyltransferase family 2 protein [Opitutaceae bacterium]|jgi:GT2 family glycosyltransferase